jgi:ABC-type transport system involved in cytochrome bd biosynthesis fused ATPase/permease subunit
LGGFDVKLTGVAVTFALFLGIIIPVGTYYPTLRLAPRLLAARAVLYRSLVNGLQGMADLLILNQQSAQREKIRKNTDAYIAQQHKFNLLNSVQIFFTNLFNHGVVWGALWAAIPLLVANRVEGVFLGTIVLGLQASQEAYLPLLQSAVQWEEIQRSARRLFKLAEPGSRTNTPPPSVLLGAAPKLQITQLGFQYPGQSTPALVDFDLELDTGKAVAVLGASGSGKTTLIRLLLRFWRYQQGQALLGGTSYEQLDEYQIRGHFSVISQTTHLFNASIAENLKLANPQATSAEMQAALEFAGLGDFIEDQPKGLDTSLGELGLKLSGGERQRSAIARAVLRKASFILCDEPTAHLDQETAKTILENILSLKKAHGILVISHNLLLLDQMDEVIILDKGKVVERGTYTELRDFFA